MSKSVYRIITFLALSLSFFLFLPIKIEAFESGTGVESDPYVITTCTHLQEIQSFPTAYYVLGQNIDCSDTINWNEGSGFQPIGGAQDFWGTLDGMYFTIYDLYINRPTESNVGLFNTVEGGIIGGLEIERAYIRGSNKVGAVAGRSSNGEFYDIHVKDSVVMGDLTETDMVGMIGGLVGSSEDDIILEYSSFEGTVSGHASVGGLLGLSVGGVNISDSYNEGTITGNYYTGGLLGRMEEEEGEGEALLSIVDSYNTGMINGKFHTGGLVGYSKNNSTLENLYNEGAVSGFIRVGGLVGYSEKDISITDSYNSGTIEGYYRVGGLLGSVEEKVTLLRSYNEGVISSLIENYNIDDIPKYFEQFICIGGLVGAGWKVDFDEVYNEGDIQAVGGSRSVGGLLGCGGLIDIQESYNIGDITTQLIVSNSLSFDGIGGLLGIGVNGIIKNSYNKGTFDIYTWESTSESFFSDQIAPSLGGLAGLTIVADIENSYSDTNVDINDIGSSGIEAAIGGLIGAEFMSESSLSDAVVFLGKTFVAKITDFFLKMVNNFVNFVIGNYSSSYENIYVGGLIGIMETSSCEGDDCELGLAVLNNNWWSSTIVKAIGLINSLNTPSSFGSNESTDHYEKAISMDIFKTYSHKVYNTDPEWDFDTIWSNVYEEKGYPVLRVQNLLMPSEPVASVASGTYTSGFDLSLSSTGTLIRYTANGSIPTCSTGSEYTTAIPVLVSSVIKAVGCIDNIPSNVSEFSYIITQPETETPTSTVVNLTSSLTTLISKKNPIYISFPSLEEEKDVVEDISVEEENNDESFSYRVRLIDKKGNVLAGAKIMIEGNEYIADNNGEIELNGLDKGKYILKITHNGNEYEQSLVLVESDEVHEVVVEDTKKFPWWIIMMLGGVFSSGVIYKNIKKEN